MRVRHLDDTGLTDLECHVVSLQNIGFFIPITRNVQLHLYWSWTLALNENPVKMDELRLTIISRTHLRLRRAFLDALAHPHLQTTTSTMYIRLISNWQNAVSN